MIERRMSVDEHGDPVLTVVATGWDGIRRIAKPLCDGTVEAGAVGYRALEVRDAYFAVRKLPAADRLNGFGQPLTPRDLMTVAEVAVEAWHSEDVIGMTPAEALLEPMSYTGRWIDPGVEPRCAVALTDAALRGAKLRDDETAEAS